MRFYGDKFRGDSFAGPTTQYSPMNVSREAKLMLKSTKGSWSKDVGMENVKFLGDVRAMRSKDVTKLCGPRLPSWG